MAESNNPGGTTFTAPQHRFFSCSKPLARCARHLPELIQTVNQIAAGGGASWAKNLLRGLTCTKLLLLGMTADLAQNATELTRFFDVEGMDIAQINEKVYSFSQQVDVLFDQGQCFQLWTCWNQSKLFRFMIVKPEHWGALSSTALNALL